MADPVKKKRRGQRHVIVETQVGVATLVADDLRQGRLPALARAVDQDDRRVRKCLDQARLREPGVKGV